MSSGLAIHSACQRLTAVARPLLSIKTSSCRPKLLKPQALCNMRKISQKTAGFKETSSSAHAGSAAVASDIRLALDFCDFDRSDTQAALAKCMPADLPPSELTFLCDNFHLDHCGVLVQPRPDMLQNLHILGYSVIAHFPSTVVLQLLKAKYPCTDISVSIWKLQRGKEKLELFEVEGLGCVEFAAESQAINHYAFSPNVLDKALVHRFKSIMQHHGMQQSSAGINSTELAVQSSEEIKGVTLVYFTQALPSTTPGSGSDGKAKLEVCMAGMHPELLEARIESGYVHVHV